MCSYGGGWEGGGRNSAKGEGLRLREELGMDVVMRVIMVMVMVIWCEI